MIKTRIETITETERQIDSAFSKKSGSYILLSGSPKKSYHFDTTFFIQTAGLAYHHASACISSAFGLYIITRQSVFSCGLMIYNAPHWWYTRPKARYTRFRTDDIHFLRKWLKLQAFLFLAVKYKSFILYPFRSIYGVSFNLWFS